MHNPLAFVFCPTDLPPDSILLPLTLTAAVVILTGYLLASIVDWRAAKTSKKHP